MYEFFSAGVGPKVALFSEIVIFPAAPTSNGQDPNTLRYRLVPGAVVVLANSVCESLS